jgi:hypothetical protein
VIVHRLNVQIVDLPEAKNFGSWQIVLQKSVAPNCETMLASAHHMATGLAMMGRLKNELVQLFYSFCHKILGLRPRSEMRSRSNIRRRSQPMTGVCLRPGRA